MEEYKGYKLERPSSLYVINPVGRGSVNKKLRGQYTSPQEAKRAIDLHEEMKRKTNGKAKLSSGGSEVCEGDGD